MKPRILLSCQSPNLTTGYGIIAKQIAQRLHDSGKYEIAVQGWHEKPHPQPRYNLEAATSRNLPYKLFHAGEFKPGDHQYDNLGRKNFGEVVDEFKPDLVIMYGDIFMVEWINDHSHRSKFKTAIYYPIDGIPIPPNWVNTLSLCDYIIPFSEFGAEATKMNLPNKPFTMIPHGIDYKFWSTPVHPAQIQVKKMDMFGMTDAFVIGMVARNQPRKNIPAFIEAFAMHAQAHPKSRLLLHMANIDQGWDIHRLCVEFGVKDKAYITPGVNAAQGVSNEDLRTIYNCMNIHVNTAWGEGCYIAGTPVDTLNGVITIEDMKPNMKVISHTGKIQTVTGVTTRHVNNNLVGIKRAGLSDTLWSTSNHPYWVIQRKYLEFKLLRENIGKLEPAWVEAGNIKNGDLLIIPKPKLDSMPCISQINLADILSDEPNLINDRNNESYYHMSKNTVTDLSLNDIADQVGCSFQYVWKVLQGIKGYSNRKNKYGEQIKQLLKQYKSPQPIKMQTTIPITKDMAEFIGLYIAEGWCQPNSIGIASHSSENYAHKLCLEVGHNIFRATSSKTIKGNSGRINISSKIASKLMPALCGTGALDKHIPYDLYSSPYNIDIIRGIFYGDGSAKNNQYTFSSISLTLIMQISQILAFHGIATRISTDNRHDNICYILGILGKYNSKFFDLIKPMKYNKIVKLDNTARNNFVLETSNYFAYPIKNIQRKIHSGPVYNMHVENDESYTVFGTATHNCGIPILESLACSIPNIAPNYSTTKELILDHNAGVAIPNNLFTVEPMTHIRRFQAHPLSLGNLFNDLYDKKTTLKEYGRNGKTAMAKYDWDLIMPQWLDTIDKILATPKLKTLKTEIL